MMDNFYEELRPRGFGIAYRMLGSVSEAEEVVQEAFLRLYRELEEGAEIESAEAYFVTVVTRLAIDELRSARARREVYTGEWLPEPILTPEADDPARHAEIADSLSLGLLVVLETLTPEERAVFLLREVFDYPHDRIAEVLGKSPGAVRQLAVRARGHVGEREPRFETSREQRDRLAASFFDAFEEGKLETLESLLADEVSLHGDGGGKAPALGQPVWGRARVARTLSAFSRAAERVGVEIRRTEVNGGPGALVYGPEGKLTNVIIVEIDAGQIQSVNSIVNPDKLAHLGPVADVGALLSRRGRP
jgi:RNA polymerase sigma-70 factor (ECF subfamily)